jgi:hypothetical protein
VKTFEELVKGLKELKKRGFVKTHRAGSTGIGKTLEDLLGIDENSFAGPDGEDTELKGARKNSSSMLTLFTKAPLPRGINSKLRKEYGYPDKIFPNKLVLRTTINAVDFNKIKGNKGFIITSKGNRIEILPAKKNSNIQNPYWLKEDFENSIKTKYKKYLLYVKANNKGSRENEEFHFNEAYLLEGFDFEKFSENLKKGILKIDIRLGLYADGSNHDHGTAIRINPDKLDTCFKIHEYKVL